MIRSQRKSRQESPNFSRIRNIWEICLQYIPTHHPILHQIMMSRVRALSLVRFLELAWSHLMSLKVVPLSKSLYLIQSRIPAFQVQLFLQIFLAEFQTSFLLNFIQLLYQMAFLRFQQPQVSTLQLFPLASSLKMAFLAP